MPGLTPLVQPCPLGDREAALEVLYRRVPASLRPRLIANALAESARGVIDLSGLWVAWRHGRIVGAMLTQPLAGRAAAVWAPEVDPTWRRSAYAIALVRSALEDLRSRGFRIVQALLDESAPRQGAADLEGGGMPHVTDLVYLERATTPPLEVSASLPAIEWLGYGPAVETEFRAVLQATYIDSLDMPELEGIRSLDDILASHRAAGRFVADRWRVGRFVGEPEAGAILLLSELPDRDAWEVAYLGLTPAARGRGLGRAMLAQALAMAAAEYVPRLELAVDVRNRPATQLYLASQFLPFDRRAVHLASLAPHEPSTS
ncbi:GNAT family N-acetyltransferase [Singulisphaera acidiphila]|uniref:Acetyltransferase n=3 Tax=Singulisphaera acidiphila TaxID=466153 RepID=L0DTA3_SINAD|nr:GNAT family N-acetyltransferase [Singulisphaera acidiphila]AGA31596.1 acetyltransferase [Singulisphaera acidiphila DSM 18658]